MKVIKKKNLQSEKLIQGTLLERQVLMSLNHPFILNLHYSFQTTKHLYLIVEHINGGDLFYHLKKKGNFQEKEARFYGAQIILALKYIHSKKIIYRDLKPENILIDKDGYIKLADFGISKLNQEENLTYSILGTAEYIAPEIFNESKGYSQEVDVWSLGCLLYELVVGTPPFQGDPKLVKNQIIME